MYLWRLKKWNQKIDIVMQTSGAKERYIFLLEKGMMKKEFTFRLKKFYLLAELLEVVVLNLGNAAHHGTFNLHL